MKEPMIDLDGAVARLPGGVLLAAPRLSVACGERVAIMGPSGAGKTTVLMLIAGVAQVAAGAVRVDGFDMAAAAAPARRAWRLAHAGLALQDFDLVDYLTIEQNIRLPAMLAGREGADGSARARGLSAALGLGALADRRPPRLSQGERQRVAIARALHGRPRLILADEATSALDPANADRALSLIFAEAAANAATVVAVTHDATLAARFDRRVALESPLATSGAAP